MMSGDSKDKQPVRCAAAGSLNITLMDKPQHKVVPKCFRSHCGSHFSRTLLEDQLLHSVNS